MNGHAHRATGLCLTVILTWGFTPRPARAEDGNTRGSLLVRAAAASNLIGSVCSVAGVLINGRLVYGESALWNGDELQSSDNEGARAVLASVGRVALTSGTRVKLAATAALGDYNGRQVLVASLTNGNMAVELDQNAGAYIEIGEIAVTSSDGAAFRIELRGRDAMIDTARGTVTREPQRRAIAKARDVNAPPSGPVVVIRKTRLDTKPNKSTPAQLQWQLYFQNTNDEAASAFSPRFVGARTQTTPPEQPIPERIVRFEVVDPSGAPSNLGTIQPEKKTDGRGVVTYTFNAGNKQGAGKIIATIDPDPSKDPDETKYEQYTRDFRIKTFWTLRNKLLIAAAAAAVIVCVVGCGPGKKPLQLVSPPHTP